MAKRKLPPDDEVARLYLSGMSQNAIAKRYGCTISVVQASMKRTGTESRSRTDAWFVARGEDPRAPGYEIYAELTCRDCGAVWKNDPPRSRVKCPFCGKAKDARDRREQAKAYAARPERQQVFRKWQADKQQRKESAERSRLLLRRRVFFRITGSICPVCVRCGCDDPRLLEINHINGGGNTELKESGKGSMSMYYAIAKGTRSTDDLELLCRPCNALHYLETKFGPLPMHMVWEGTDAD